MLFTPSPQVDTLILGILALMIFHIARAMYRRRFFAFDPLLFFWAGVIVIYVSEGISNYDFYVLRYSEEVVTATFVWILIGMFLLHFGYRLRYGPVISQKVPYLPQRISPNKMLFAAVLLTALGAVGWTLQIMSVGSIAAWAATPRGGENWEELSPYVGQLTSFLTVGLSLLLLHVEMHRRGFLARMVAWALIAFLLLFFLYLGSRSRFIGVLLVALMSWSLPRRRSPSVFFLAPLGLALFVLISFQTEYREHFRNFSFNLHEIDLSEAPRRILPRYITGDQSTKPVSLGTEFSMTAAVVDLVPGQIPYALGGEFLQLFTHGIPRSIWPNKPFPRGELWSLVHQQAGTSEWWVEHVRTPYIAGPAPGYIASWYYNGGLIGLLVGGVVTGIFLRAVRGIYDRSRENESYLVLYLVLAPIGFGEAVSHPFNWIYALPLILIPLVVILKLLQGRLRPRHPDRSA